MKVKWECYILQVELGKDGAAGKGLGRVGNLGAVPSLYNHVSGPSYQTYPRYSGYLPFHTVPS